MIYQLYQAHADLMYPLRRFARIGAGMARLCEFGPYTPSTVRHFSAVFSLIAESGMTHHRPSFGMGEVMVGERVVGVTEKTADDTPFGTLLRFRKDSNV